MLTAYFYMGMNDTGNDLKHLTLWLDTCFHPVLLKFSGCVRATVISPKEVVGDVDVALCSGQQEHDKGIIQVTLKL